MPVIFQNVSFHYPGGKFLFTDLHLALEHKIYALVGPNGAGKSTLAKLICGELPPQKGSVGTLNESVFYFPQFEEAPEISVTEYLMDSTYFEESSNDTLLKDIDLERSCRMLSGGEWTRVRLARAQSIGATFIILDEPTNHLDQKARLAVTHFMTAFKGGILLITHDRKLLEYAEKILELTTHGITLFSGTWKEFNLYRTQERKALLHQLEITKKNKSEAEQKRREKIDVQKKRQERGARNALKGGTPKIILGMKKRAAQETMGKIDKDSMDDLSAAVDSAFLAYQKIKVDPVMFAELPDVHLPGGKSIAEARNLNFYFPGELKPLWKANLHFSFAGPVRVGIIGANGSGKTTLLKMLAGLHKSENIRGELSLGLVKRSYLDQSYAMLNGEKDIFKNVQSTSALNDVELRNALAMFLFKGDEVYQKMSSLSGGEVLRAALAKIFLSKENADVLMLDEPTNNLDMPNILFLEQLLKTYRGALFVVSHDSSFLEALELDTLIELEKS